MRSHPLPRAVAVVLTLSLAVGAACSPADEDPLEGRLGEPPAFDETGRLTSGATWQISAPDDWNGTLLLYSHGAVPLGSDNPAEVALDGLTARGLLAQGYAIAGTSYASTGWALEDALADQVSLLDVVDRELGAPDTTIAWGASLGGLVTVGLLEAHPDRFDGGMAACGILGGADALWDTYLDAMFVARELLAPGPGIRLTGFAGVRDAQAQLLALQAAAREAETTPEGRARIALAAAVADLPGWAGPGSARPDADDLTARGANLFLNLAGVGVLAFGLRADVEARVGGNPSTNVGVDYGDLIAAADERVVVEGLYAKSGLDLTADLTRLAAAPRIAADPGAREALLAPVRPSGELADPLLTLHDEGDGYAVVQHERAYADRVRAAGREDLLRQATVARAGHCAFTSAEVLTAIDTVVDRVHEGRWPDTDGAAMDRRAEDLGPDLNVLLDEASDARSATPPSFSDIEPTPLPRDG